MKKRKVDLSKVERLYTENYEKFGISSKSVGWSTEDSQKLRFEKLMLAADSREPFSLNELGCGYGELFHYCMSKGSELTAYNGYEISQAMLDAARGHVTDARARFFRQSVISEVADYSVTSGIFNVIFDHDAAAWEQYIIEVLDNMFKFSTKAMAFNLLTKYVDYRTEGLYYADPEYFFRYCKTKLSRYVSLYHDYPLYEWTIVVRK